MFRRSGADMEGYENEGGTLDEGDLPGASRKVSK